jgi:hypothetical protein
MIALAAAALIAAAPVVFAQSSETPRLQHKLTKKHPLGVSGYARWHEMKARGSRKGYPRAFGYAPSEPRNYEIEALRQAGGGGGGGGGSGM